MCNFNKKDKLVLKCMYNVRVLVLQYGKEFTKSGSKVKGFIYLPSKERDQTLRVMLVLKGKGFELLIDYKGQGGWCL